MVDSAADAMSKHAMSIVTDRRTNPARDSEVKKFPATKPLRLDSGEKLVEFEIAYKTWGELNADKSNAILVCHALTMDQYVAGTHPVTGKPGWWTRLVGDGQPIDPARHFIICANVIGGCMGSTGPASLNPETGKPYGLAFPVLTIGDMVRAQAMLVEALGIETLFSVIGGSMGGMQVLQWAADFPEKLFSAICIASTAKHSAQNIALHEVGRQAIMADPNWRGGEYASHNVRPEKGLAVARMGAHITYVSEDALQQKFGRGLQSDGLSWGFDADFQVESYLRHQGVTFVDRFDANAYLYITRAMDYFDLSSAHGGQLAKAFMGARGVRFCVLSFTSDWLYPTRESREIIRALNAAGCRASFLEIVSDNGHDAFLLDEPEMHAALDGFLAATGQERGLT
jgi:homoserine O-acetyltransferase